MMTRPTLGPALVPAVTALLAMLLAAAPARGDEVDFNLAGWATFGNFGHNSNSSAQVNIGAGSLVTDAEWIALSFTTANGSWRSDFVISLNTFGTTPAFWETTVTADESGGTYSGSGTFPGPDWRGGPFTADAAGNLYVELYESINDAGNAVDATVSGGILRVHYTPLPEPSVAVAGAAAMALLLGRRRD